LLRQIDEVLAAAVHWQDVGEIELLQLRHHLAQVVVGCGCQMETADEGVDLFNPADLLGTTEGVDDAGMAIGTDDDESPVAEPEASRVLVPMLIRLRYGSSLHRRGAIGQSYYRSRHRPARPGCLYRTARRATCTPHVRP